MNNKDEIVEIFAGEFYQASMIKDLLEDNNIEVFIENEMMGNIAPWYETKNFKLRLCFVKRIN